MCSEELKAAQHWNGPSVIELLKQQPVYVHANSLLPCKFRTTSYLPRIVAYLHRYERQSIPGIDISRFSNSAGGSWLITDMRRGETIFEVDPQLQVSFFKKFSLNVVSNTVAGHI